MKTKDMTKIALIAAIYVVITIAFYWISYGPIQVRVSEAMTLLPYFMGYPAAVGLLIGVFIANIAGGLGLIDIIFGPLITFFAAILTARASSIYKAGIYPVLFNALGVGLILYFIIGLEFFAADTFASPFLTGLFNYLAHVFFVGIGQFIAIYIIGIPLMKLLDKKINLGKL